MKWQDLMAKCDTLTKQLMFIAKVPAAVLAELACDGDAPNNFVRKYFTVDDCEEFTAGHD